MIWKSLKLFSLALLLGLPLLLYPCYTFGEENEGYWISESELTQLETTLTNLEENNEELKRQARKLEESQMTIRKEYEQLKRSWRAYESEAERLLTDAMNRAETAEASRIWFGIGGLAVGIGGTILIQGLLN